MKLSQKFTLWFVGVIIVVTPISSYITYNTVKKQIGDAEIMRLVKANTRAARRLANGRSPLPISYGIPTTVSVYKGVLPEQKTQFSKISSFNKEFKHQECRLTAFSYFTIGETNYKIESYSFLMISDQIFAGILEALLLKTLIVIIVLAITVKVASRQLLKPLQQTLAALKEFHVKDRKKIELPPSGTKEFNELSTLLSKMSVRVIEEYSALKEFSENASHEVQTPLAIIRSKLELLTESDIGERQAALIVDMQNAVERLSKINRSLLLLTKLENQEFDAASQVKLCRITREVLSAYEDRLELKNLQVETNIDKNVLLKIHPVLGDIMLNNLIGNAIRHNIQDGQIQLKLTDRQLVIKNTGHPPQMPTEQLFQRFKKSGQHNESLGLGLAIVKQICDSVHYRINYQYQQPLHIITVDFTPRSMAI